MQFKTSSTLLSLSLVIGLLGCAPDNNLRTPLPSGPDASTAPSAEPSAETPSSGSTSDANGTNGNASGTPSSGSCERGEILGYLEVLSAEDLVVAQDHAYVFAKNRGVHVFDVSNPSAPRALKVLNDDQGVGQAWDGVVQGNRLYVAYRQAGVLIYDIQNPAEPQLLGQAQSEGLNVNGAAVSGNKLIASGGTGSEGRLSVFDISSPSAPSFMGSATVSGSDSSGSSVAVRGNTAYYGQAQGNLRIFDISAEQPQEIQVIENPGTPGHSPWALGLHIEDDHLYLSNWGGGWTIFSLQNPQAPQRLGTFADKFAAYDADVVGDRLIGAAPEGLYLVDISDKGNPRLIGEGPLNIKAPGELDDGAHGVQVVGDVAFVADNKQQGFVSVCVGS